MDSKIADPDVTALSGTAELTSRGAALATAASLRLQAKADLPRVGAHEAMSG
jgi:hypothetical protein